MNSSNFVMAKIRRHNLKEWFSKNKIPKNEKSFISQLISGKAPFGEKAARRLEHTYKMPSHYLDMDINESMPQHGSRLSCQQMKLLELFSRLPDSKKNQHMESLLVDVEEYEGLLKEAISIVTSSMKVQVN